MGQEKPCLLTHPASSPTGPSSFTSSPATPTSPASSPTGPTLPVGPAPSPVGPASGLCTSVNLFPTLSVVPQADSSCERSIYK